MSRDVETEFEAAGLWREEALALRPILLGAGLVEVLKWNKPCYLASGHNICILQRMSGFLALMFFKGRLIADPDAVLEPQGRDSRSAARITFRSLDEVEAKAEAVRAAISRAIAAAEAGLEPPAAEEPDWPEELIAALEGDELLSSAWDALTPGRRRYWVVHIAEPKTSKSRAARIEKGRGRILAGKGVNER